MKAQGLAVGWAVVWLVLAAGVLASCQKPAAPEKREAAAQTPAPQGPEKLVVAIGDSLFAGYGLRPEQAYPVRLQAALRARGINARVVNAGVSGDTTADGLARLAFTLGSQPRTPDLVLISLGGNDLLRGLPPEQARANLDAMLAELGRRKVPVVVMGMLAPPNMGKDYVRRFDAIYPALARAHGAGLVPFFLQAIIGKDALRLPDRVHPTAAGVDAMVGATVDTVAGATTSTD